MKKDIWVLLEVKNDKLKSVCLGLIEEGRRLADEMGGSLSALVWGEAQEGLSALTGQYGADYLMQVKHPALSREHPQVYDRLLTKLVIDQKPHLVIAAATPFGAEVLAKVSAQVKCPLVTNCIEIDLTNGLEMTKPIQNGRLHATLICRSADTTMVTLLPEALDTGQFSFPTKTAETVTVEPLLDNDEFSVCVKGFVKADHRTIDIAHADTIIAIGRGISTQEEMAPIQVFADRIGAAIGGTRPMVDNSFLPYDRQIGQTGKCVAPKLIILCGISGAKEFMKGIERAGTKLVINNDPDAPVFKSADVAILGNVNSFIAKASERLNRMPVPLDNRGDFPREHSLSTGSDHA